MPPAADAAVTSGPERRQGAELAIGTPGREGYGSDLLRLLRSGQAQCQPARHRRLPLMLDPSERDNEEEQCSLCNVAAGGVT